MWDLEHTFTVTAGMVIILFFFTVGSCTKTISTKCYDTIKELNLSDNARIVEAITRCNIT